MKKLFTILLLLTVFVSCKKDDEVTPDSSGLKTKVIEIGDWNMDTYIEKEVAHGLSSHKIRSVTILIKHDDNEDILELDYANPANAGAQGAPGGSFVVGGTNIVMDRVTGNFFDGAGFDYVPYNRGWIYITYVE